MTELSGDATGDARPDADLVAAHAAGDVDAFGELVRRHRDRLWAVALRTLGDREEAADALQDALVSAFRAGASGASGAFRGESAVTTWLHRIVVNACLDRVRRRAARPTDPLPDHDVPARGPDPVAARETALDVQAALAQLPVEQRAALVLVDMYGWSVEEAAQVLGCPTGTVKSRCARGRARLVPLLRPAGTAGGDAAGTAGGNARGNHQGHDRGNDRGHDRGNQEPPRHVPPQTSDPRRPPERVSDSSEGGEQP